MFRRLSGIFQRYQARHLHLTCPGAILRDTTGAQIAQIDEITVFFDRIEVSCRSPLDDLLLEDDMGFQTRLVPATDPGMGRDSADDSPLSRFSATVSLHGGGVRLIAPSAGAASVSVPLPGRFRQGVARFTLVFPFMISVLRALPLILRWSRTGDLNLRPRIRKTLGLALEPKVSQMTGTLFRTSAVASDVTSGPRITIIMPVFNAFDLLPEVLERVSRHTDLPWHLILVEDASTDPRVRPWLHQWMKSQADGLTTLIENDTNLGFIGSVNAGFQVAINKGGIAVLLNSDVFVPANWASRIVQPFVQNPHVASVTPMSNDAEILTVPIICKPQALAPGQGDAIDGVAARFSMAATVDNLPTGVGFCMAISNQWLAKVPTFDPVFGRGYGEEVDWCQKIRARGGIHVGLPGLFVEHRGGASFGSDDKRRLIAANNRIVSQRYPRFPIETETFILEDPLSTPRLALAIAWAATRTDQRLPVYIAHSLGGGAEIWLEGQIARMTAKDGPGAALVLRVGGPFRWRLELHLPENEKLMGDTNDLALISAMLEPAQCNWIYSCAVGDSDPVTVPTMLASLKQDRDHLEILFHDYLPLSPSYTLLDADGRFRGPLRAGNVDPAHQATRPDGQRVSLDQWRTAWRDLFDLADWLTVFSEDSRRQVMAALPDFVAKVRVVPHALHTRVPKIPEPAATELWAVGILGNIGMHKGLDIVARLAEMAGGMPGVVVIGNTDPGYPVPASVKVHGSYSLADLPSLARKYAIRAWLIPSIWPETFSYTTHEALATGLPVFGFALGAQGDALKAHPNGHPIGYGEADVMVQDLLRSLRSMAGHG